MKLLVLGGTRFLGRHVAAAALAAGHELTLLHRGRTAPGLFPAARTLAGDRDGDLSALRGERFDAVIDCCGYTAAQVGRAAEALAGCGAGVVLFVSSISVVAACPPGQDYDEDAPRLDGDDGYGANKARAEDALHAAWGARAQVLRPGLIVGPHDPTGRFTYWPRRLARGGAVLAPGRPQRPLQFIDVRDLAEWCLRLAARGTGGAPLHAVGPAVTMAALLQACSDVAGVPATPHWRDDATLLARGVAPWTELPLWIPEGDAQAGGLMRASRVRALAAGLRARPLHDTVAATLAWAQGPEGAVAETVTTLTPEREAALLAA